MLRFKLFDQQPIKHALTSVKEGNIDLRYSKKSTVVSNISTICSRLNIKPKNVVQMEQVHNSKVYLVSSKEKGKTIKGADGLITKDADLVLMLRVADCIPIFLFDKKKKVVGLLHSGWRGTIGKIALIAIEKMILNFKSDPNNILVALGPSINFCCNLWKDKPIQSELPEWQQFINKRGKKYSIDLPGFVVDTLLSAGIKKSNIEISAICTVMNKSYFSHKRAQRTGEKQGRFTALIGLIK